MEKQEDEGNALHVLDVELWAGVGHSTAKVGTLVARLRVSAVIASGVVVYATAGRTIFLIQRCEHGSCCYGMLLTAIVKLLAQR